jgi:hypothetical protein
MSNNKQSSVDKEFVPYEQALALKELGFDEKCFCNWEESWSPEPEHEIRMVLTTDQTWLRPGWISAPTFSRAFRWFRDKHKLGAIISQFGWGIENELGQIVHNISDSENPLCYEEAELECLKKLIEIFKNK